MSELALMSDCISCSHVRFLNKKYDIYNNINFNNQLKVNNTNNFNITNNPERVSFLNTLNTNKKSCNYSFENIPPILTKTDKEDSTWENQFKTHIFPIKDIFNINTKIKTNKITNNNRPVI
jgi:hypothetical protein